MWAVGAVLAELLTGRPLFPGATEADQIALLGAVLGPPHPRPSAPPPPPCAAAALAAVRGPPSPRAALEAALGRGGGGVPPGAVDALSALLALDPSTRPTATAALALPFLAKAVAAVAADGLIPRGVAPHKATAREVEEGGKGDTLIRARHAADAPSAPLTSIAVVADGRWAVDDVEAPAMPPARVAVAKARAPAAAPPPLRPLAAPKPHRCPRADSDLAAAAAVLEAAVATAAAEGLSVADALARRPSNAV